jgi:hypothetical protein
MGESRVIAEPNRVRTEYLSTNILIATFLVRNAIPCNEYNKFMKKLKFEWDNHKDKLNIKKHGVSFDEARTVFYDVVPLPFFPLNIRKLKTVFFYLVQVL